MLGLRSRSRTAADRGLRFTTSPLLSPALPAWRSRCVMLVLGAMFLALALRAIWLQGMADDFLQRQGAARHVRHLDLPAERGRILDRHGVVLAASVPARAVAGNPRLLAAAAPGQLEALAGLLGIDGQELARKLESRRDFVYLKRQVEPAVAAQALALGLPGLETRVEARRRYPYGELAAHLVGFTDIEDVGQEGMELAAQASLAGSGGSRRVLRDRLGRVVEDLGGSRAPRDGHDLVLALDHRIQHVARAHLKTALETHQARAAGIVVLDVASGEVLALANLPDYDPNARARLSGAQLRNRVLTDTFEPGSVIKPFTIALALESGLATPETLVDTAPGRMRIGSATIGDASRHGTLTVSQVLEKSSNIGVAKLALQMPAEAMWTLLTEVGFGQAPALGFPGTAAGRLRPHRSWKPIEQATIAYGHGMSTSLLQMAQSYLVFARDGEMVPVSLFRQDGPPPARRVLSRQTAGAVRTMMEAATGPGGTAPRARVPGYRVAGKTSTAHKVVDGRYANRYVAGFVGLAPASKPRIVVAVMVDEPTVGGHYGGRVAAPVFANVTRDVMRLLNVSPDAPVDDILAPAEGAADADTVLPG